MLNRYIWTLGGFKINSHIKSYTRKICYINLLNTSYLKNITCNNSSLLQIYKRYGYKDIKNTVSIHENAEEIHDIEHIGGKVIDITLNSLRLDVVLKTGLGKSRKKIEFAFYNNKIRKNGENIKKKSNIINIGDEIDLIDDEIPDNSSFLIVSRIKIVAIKFEADYFKIKVIRDNKLLIEK